MSYEDEKNIAGETEALSSDDQNMSRLLSDLKRVDAPKDFDFHLKARIANASPRNYQPVRLFPVLKYALPLALFLMVGGAFILNSSYRGWNVPPVADLPNTSGPSVAQDINPGQQAEVNSVPTHMPNNELVAENPPTDTKEFVVGSTKDPKLPKSSRPSSLDFTGNNAPSPIPVLRPGQGNSNSKGNSGEAVTSGALEFRQVLRSIGINADQSEGGWTVRSLVKNGVAERSGLRVGDLMEAIDDKPINTLYDGSFSVKSISVRRDGKVAKIDLKFQ